VNVAREIANELKTRGFIQRGHFGFETRPLSAEMSRLLDLQGSAGLYVTRIHVGSPASGVGLRVGDVIVSFNNIDIDHTFDPQTFTADSTPGKPHCFGVVRDGETVQIKAVMQQEQPWIDEPRIPIDAPTAESFEYLDEALGLGLENLNTGMIRELDLPKSATGILITHVLMDSVAYREGLAAGMLVVRVNNQAIANLKVYRDVISKLSPSKRALFLVQVGNDAHLVLLRAEN
jgi:serine protease Do